MLDNEDIMNRNNTRREINIDKVVKKMIVIGEGVQATHFFNLCLFFIISFLELTMTFNHKKLRVLIRKLFNFINIIATL